MHDIHTMQLFHTIVYDFTGMSPEWKLDSSTSFNDYRKGVFIGVKHIIGCSLYNQLGSAILVSSVYYQINGYGMRCNVLSD